MKADTIGKAATVAGKQHGDAGVAVVVERIAQHGGLQQLVHALLAALKGAAFQQLDSDAFILQPVPDMPEFRGDGADGDGVLDIPSGARQFQQVPKGHADSRTSRIAFALGGDLLRTDEDIRVVPVNEDSIHVGSLSLFLPAHGW